MKWHKWLNQAETLDEKRKQEGEDLERKANSGQPDLGYKHPLEGWDACDRYNGYFGEITAWTFFGRLPVGLLTGGLSEHPMGDWFG
jgi:hypothetical protein